MAAKRLSYVIISHNRRERLLRTLEVLHRFSPLPEEQWDLWVVDSASTDGTAAAVWSAFPRTCLIALTENHGLKVREFVFRQIRSDYVMLLDDDSYPEGDTALRSIEYLDAHPAVAAVGGRCTGLDGTEEAAELPGILLGGGVVLRHAALEAVGGLNPQLPGRAAESDLSLRFLASGYRVERFRDLVYRRERSRPRRSDAQRALEQLLGDLLLAERFLPADVRRAYRSDWLRRGVLAARAAGATLQELAETLVRARHAAAEERASGRPMAIEAETLEAVFQWEQHCIAITNWVQSEGIQRVALADRGANLFAAWRACRRLGLQVVAVLEDRPGLASCRYRGIPVLGSDQLPTGTVDGIIVSETNPARIAWRAETLAREMHLPVLHFGRPAEIGRGWDPMRRVA